MEALFSKRTVILCALGVLILSTLPVDKGPGIEIENLYKFDRLIMYAVLSAMLYGYFVNSKKQSKLRNWLAAFLLASAYGVLMEILQYYFLETRSFEVYDIISNIIGSFIGIFMMIIFFNSKK